MAKKIFGIGILALVLVFGMTAVGCDMDTSASIRDNEFLIRNRSSHTIVVEDIWSAFAGIRPHDFVLAPGSEQLVRGENDFFVFAWTWFRQDTGNETGVTFSYQFGSVRTGTFRNN